MLGSTVFPWLMSGQSLLRLEDCLVYIYALLGIVFSIVAYDYQVTYLLVSQKCTSEKLICFIWKASRIKDHILQEIRILVVLFCLFHGFAGLALPLLARLRTM